MIEDLRRSLSTNDPISPISDSPRDFQSFLSPAFPRKSQGPYRFFVLNRPLSNILVKCEEGKDKLGRDSPLRTPGWAYRSDSLADSYLYGVPSVEPEADNVVSFRGYGREEPGSFLSARRPKPSSIRFDKKIQFEVVSSIARSELSKPISKVNAGYLYRQRWIWKVDYKSSLSSIVEALVSLRLSEGFWVLNTEPVYTFFTEIPIRLNETNQVVNSYLQYIFYIRQGALVTELWYEPQHGTIHYESDKGGCAYDTESLWIFLKRNFREVDGIVISAFCTFDELNQTLNETVGGSNIISINKEKDIADCEEYTFLLEQNIPYTEIILRCYDVDALLKKSMPKEEYFPCWNTDLGSPLYALLHSALVKHSDATLVIEDGHSRRHSNGNNYRSAGWTKNSDYFGNSDRENSNNDSNDTRRDVESHTKHLSLSGKPRNSLCDHDYLRYRHLKGVSDIELIIATLEPTTAMLTRGMPTEPPILISLSRLASSSETTQPGDRSDENRVSLNQTQVSQCTTSSTSSASPFLQVNYHQVSRNALVMPTIQTEIPTLIGIRRRRNSQETPCVKSKHSKGL